jgi:hypothetical protein
MFQFAEFCGCFVRLFAYQGNKITYFKKTQIGHFMQKRWSKGAAKADTIFYRVYRSNVESFVL